MVGKRATKAKGVIMTAADGGDDAAKVSLLDGAVDRVLALWGRTPLQIFFIIDVCSGEKHIVSGLDIGADE